jgi:hypothetical protein
MDRFIIKIKATSQHLIRKDGIQYDLGKRKLIEKYYPNLKEMVRTKIFGQ